MKSRRRVVVGQMQVEDIFATRQLLIDGLAERWGSSPKMAFEEHMKNAGIPTL